MPVPIVLSPGSFEQSRVELALVAPAPVVYRPGNRPCLITSVHGYAHIRDSREKQKDSGSLELAHLLAASTGAHWLGVGKPGELDSNHHRDTPFKRRLAELTKRQSLKLVVDIHTAHALRPFDVEIGSLNQASWQGQLERRDTLSSYLEQSGFLVADNQVFTAQGSTFEAQTVTMWCFERGIPCVQLEVSSALISDLNSRQALHANAKLANAIAAFVQLVV